MMKYTIEVRIDDCLPEISDKWYVCSTVKPQLVHGMCISIARISILDEMTEILNN